MLNNCLPASHNFMKIEHWHSLICLTQDNTPHFTHLFTDLRTFFALLQGLFVAIFYCFLNGEVSNTTRVCTQPSLFVNIIVGLCLSFLVYFKSKLCLECFTFLRWYSSSPEPLHSLFKTSALNIRCLSLIRWVWLLCIFTTQKYYIYFPDPVSTSISGLTSGH